MPSGPTIPKPSVALCRPKPMISTVARPIAPDFAETPIASPSAKLCRPIANAIVIPLRSATRRASNSYFANSSAVSIAAASPPATGGRTVRRRRYCSIPEMPAVPAVKPTARSANSPTTCARLPSFVLVAVQRRFDDRLTVTGHIDEDERQDSDREHRQRDACAVGNSPKPPHRQAEVDRETGDCTEQHRFRKAHSVSPRLLGQPLLGRPKFYHSGRYCV